MPRPNMKNIEKPKDFKTAISRLMKELSKFKVLVTISLVLAALSSILSIFSPNILSDLTDEISQGLVVNQENLTELSTTIQNSFSEEKITTTIPQILEMDLSQNTIAKIISSSDISQEDKETFNSILTDTENIQMNISKIPTSILEIILKDTTYNNVSITKEAKITFIKSLETSLTIPDSIAQVLFEEIEIANTKISSSDQARFLELLSKTNENINPQELYQKIDKMPENIQNLIKPTMNIDKIKEITLFLVFIFILSAVFSYVQSITMTIVANKFAMKLRGSISTKINKLPLKYFDTNQTGDILSRVTNDVDTIAFSMNNSLATLVSAISLFVGTIIMMFVTNWIMAITAILSSLLGFSFMSLVLGKSQKYFSIRQKELGNLNGHIEEIYSSLNVVKAYNGKKNAEEKFDELNKKLYEANRKSQFLSGLMHPMMHFIGNFGYVAVCIVGALLTMNGKISFGVIVAFISYVRLFTSPLSQIAQAMTRLQTTAASSERVFEFLDEREMSNQKEIKKYLDKKDVVGKVTFENVEFKYDENGRTIINNFSATAKPGQKIAIVGPTGAGKTTMVNLLMKFYEINKGNILIDDVSINELTRENIHELFTMVLQDAWLFDGTVKENIAYNRKNVTDEQIKNICEKIGLDHFIKTLPNGYDSILSENDSISSGQRQLLTIARGMVEDAPFLILDEATSNVDTRTEELVQIAMDKLTEGKTSFIIAHRLSTIKNADLILVMKDGNIIEQGNHNSLMKENGFYAKLYNSQFEL